jgi:hypothetical protein
MTDTPNLDLEADPRVRDVLRRIAGLVPDANTSQMVRAALLHFGEAVPDHEIEIYVKEQMGFDLA